MPNQGVQGRVIDEGAIGIQGLLVEVYDHDVLSADDRLGDPKVDIVTDASGHYSVTYPASAYGLEANPDIYVRVYDKVKRLLFVSPVHKNVTDTTFSFPDIVIHRKDAEGWLVTLGTGAPVSLTTGNSIEFLVDNADAWPAITAAVRNATSFVHFLQLYLDVNKEFTNFPVGIDFNRAPNPGDYVPLEAELLKANQAPRSLPVRVTMNDFLLLPYPMDTAGPVDDYFKKSIPNTANVHSFTMPVFTPMHAKLVSVDGTECFTVGSPFLQEYFDTSSHKIDNPERGPMSGPPIIGGFQHSITIPIHDVSSHVKGPAVADMNDVFVLHYNVVRGADAALTRIAVPPVEPDNVALQVLRTVKGGTLFPTLPEGETGILEAYLRAIRNAKDYIYIEDQYLSCPDIGVALLRSLQDPDPARANLQVILLINNKVDLPLYGTWQKGFLADLTTALTDSQKARLGVFSLWTHEAANPPDNPKPRIMRNYVHSKVAIVDNVWATVGSANLDMVSLKNSDYLSRVIEDVLLKLVDFSKQRGSEANAVMYQGIDGQPATTDVVGRLLRRLWSEHLGFLDGSGDPNPSAPELAARPAKGWLDLWNQRANDKINGLQASPGAPVTARILPFPHDDKNNITKKYPDPDDYLGAIRTAGTNLPVKIDLTQFGIVEGVRAFSFATGKWK